MAPRRIVEYTLYYSGSRGFETLPSDIYLFKNFTAADSGGCPILLQGGLSIDERQVRLVCTCLECTGKPEKDRARVSSTLASSPKCLSDTSNSECAEGVRSLTQNEHRLPIGQTRPGVFETGLNTSVVTGRQDERSLHLFVSPPYNRSAYKWVIERFGM